MRWTRRDTSYLLAILALSMLLIYLMLERRISTARPEGSSRIERIKAEGDVPGISDGGVLIDNKPRLQRMHATPDKAERRVVAISKEMTREELAQALGILPADLPPE